MQFYSILEGRKDTFDNKCNACGRKHWYKVHDRQVFQNRLIPSRVRLAFVELAMLNLVKVGHRCFTYV